MKRLWIAVVILGLVFAATLYNTRYLSALTASLSATLTRAEERAALGDWPAAGALTDKAKEQWESHTLYLHVFLRHNDTDDVEIGFHEVKEFITHEEQGEYSAANARLIAEVGLLYEAEQLSLKNVL